MVVIQNGSVELFLPFCNTQYRNQWGMSGKEHWWANGWLVCEQPPPNGMSASGLCALKNMMESCAPGMRDRIFFLNKRDSPCVRQDGCDPMNPFHLYQKPVVRPMELLTVYSGYTGDQFLDVACPLAKDWADITQSTFAAQNPYVPDPPIKDVYWEAKEDMAVFRGSLTGSGLHDATNQRRQLCNLRHPNLDAKPTGCNYRIKFCPIERQMGLPAHCALAGREHYMRMEDQKLRYKYTVAIDGHSAMDRLGSLLDGTQCILKIASPMHALAPETWVSRHMHEWEHFIPVPTVHRLGRRIEWAIASPSAVQRICRNAAGLHKRIMTRTYVQAWWKSR